MKNYDTISLVYVANEFVYSKPTGKNVFGNLVENDLKMIIAYTLYRFQLSNFLPKLMPLLLFLSPVDKSNLDNLNL